MAVLTWRNVEAPNFAGSVQGVRTAADLLSNATTAAQQGLTGFQQGNQDITDRQILSEMIGIQDPRQFQQALGGLQGRGASSNVLQYLDRRTPGLQTLADTQYKSDRTREDDQLWDAARGGANAGLVAAYGGDPATARDQFSNLNLRPAQLQTLLGDANTFSNGASARGVAQTKATKEAVDKTNTQNATALAYQLLGNDPDPRMQQGSLNRWVEAGGDPVVANMAAEIIEKRSGGFLGPVVGAPASGGRAGGIPSGSRSQGAGLSVMTGGATLPDTIRTVGDFVDNKRQLLQINPQGTATGKYQITADTWTDFAPRALGSDWRNADIRDPEVQDKVAQSIWESANGSAEAIRNRWVSFTPEQARAAVGKPWSEVRNQISMAESSTPAEAIVDRALTNQRQTNVNQNVDTSLAERRSENYANTGITPENYDAAIRDTETTPFSASKRLTEKGGILEGTNRAVIQRQIERMVTESRGPDGRARLSPAVAEQMIVNSIQASPDNSFLGGIENLGRRLTGPRGGNSGAILVGGTPRLGNNQRINDTALQERFDNYLTGATSAEAAGTRSLENNAVVLQQAQQDFAAKQERATALTQAARTNPTRGYLQAAERAVREMEQARAVVQEAQRAGVSSPSLRPTRDVTTPQQIPVASTSVRRDNQVDPPSWDELYQRRLGF